MNYFQQRIIIPLKGYLQSGLSPHQIALGVAIGGTIGLMPFLGVSTWICVAIATYFRLNMGVIQIANYAMYPLQFVLYVPYLRGAIFLFGLEPSNYDIDYIITSLQANLWETLYQVWWVNLLGIIVWIFTSPLFFIPAYWATSSLVKKYKKM